MKFDFIVILYCLLCTWFMGYLIKRLFLFGEDEYHYLGNIAVCFGLGTGIIYYLVFFSSFLLAIPYVLCIYLFLLILLMISLKLKKPNFQNKIQLGTWDISKLTLVTMLILIIFYQVIEGYWGQFGWDGFAIWGFKGKAIFLDNKINVSLLTDFKHYSYAHMHYPLLFPANEAWIYSHLGYVNDQGVRLLSVAYYLALLFVFYGGIRHYVSCHVSLLLTFLLAALPVLMVQGTNGNSDLPLAFFILTGTIYLLRWKNNKQINNLVFAAIFYGLGAQVKQEGTYMLYMALLIGLLFIGMDILKKKHLCLKTFCVYFGIIVTLYLPWSIIIWKYNIRGWTSAALDSFGWLSIVGKQKIILFVLEYYFQEILNFSIWGFLWFFIILGFILFLCKLTKQGNIYLLWILFIFQNLLYFVVYTFYLNGTLWYLYTSLTRTLLSVAPVAYFAAVLTLCRFKEKYQEL